jgi:hypothetical protein
MDIALTETMKCLARLAGAWTGTGEGGYPTIDPFQYREALTFTPAAGKAYLHYDQRTWRRDDSGQEVPSHWESGFWRILPEGQVELLCVQASGRVEVARGRLHPTGDGFSLELRSSLFANDARVEQTWREYDLRGDTLRYALKMQTAAVPALTWHVRADLRRR